MTDEKMKMSPEEQELLEQQFARDLENAKQEIVRGEQNLKEHEFVLEQQREILRLIEESKEKVLAHMKVVNPLYAYETLPEYTELLKAQQSLKWEQEIFMLKEKSIPGLEKTVAAKKEHLESLRAKIATMEGGDDE